MSFIKKLTLNNILFIYIILVIIYTLIFYFFDDAKKVPLTSNELGDFLAGFFAPLAFLFIYLGFKQQGEAIKKSNDAIKQQLDIQNEMIKLQKAERLEIEHSAKPILTFKPEIVTGNEIQFQNNNFTETSITYKSRLKLTFGNKGSKITHISIRCVKPFFKLLNSGNDVLDTNGVLTTENFIDRGLFTSKSNELSDIDIEIIYTTSIGATYKSLFEISIPQGIDGNTIIYTCRDRPIRIN